MSFDNTKLLDFLDEIEKELTRKIVVVAVGGTAMTLLKAKFSTIDVDFTIPDQYYDDFEHAMKIVQPDFKWIGIMAAWCLLRHCPKIIWKEANQYRKPN
ncbi:MAG: hypothetical protein KGI02_08650 [Thaumarchaeota archaeon]|nr:hypothetical protein [Nitrososphaerota archaeon]